MRYTVKSIGPDHSFEFCSRACLDPWMARDQDQMQARRVSACAQGYHRPPGWPGHARWSRDPDDPYGDAALWECTKGCGHQQRSAGYGIGKAIYDHLGPAEHARWLAGQRHDPKEKTDGS
ncbi:hypothetical protein [Actinomadura violacea]|uniref:Uncharacterized protein n=1 Tax=Actinomadura violacea TaxID=2819934 RepID=A0ABS3RXN0_9ACTN|nr:hypothetical protein [Actinomadura violacea]MBO2461505.1 hypothetical protein [Actinomadura violacea]